jgi:transketolase
MVGKGGDTLGNNLNLRKKIADMVCDAKMGHIPSSFSIVDIINTVYKNHLKVDPKRPDWEERDYFILSKGHGCVALYAVLQEQGFLTDNDIDMFCKFGGILGEHPDFTKVPGAEASTGSLGHGLPFAVGVALGLKIKKRSNKTIVLLGDGECHEGTIWEAANVANNMQLGNICVIVDWNGSAAQLMPKEQLAQKWEAFGWRTCVIDGHSEKEISAAIKSNTFEMHGTPLAIVAKTIKGKGVAMLEGHGQWHHKIPNENEYKQIMESLS